MKKAIKRLVIYFLSLSLLITNFLLYTVAANDTILSFSKNSVPVGESVTVIISVNGTVISGVDLTITYDASVLSYSSGDAHGGAGSLKIVDDASPAAKQTYKITFDTIKSGSSPISVSGGISDGQFPNVTDVTLKGASALLNVTDVTLSANANLSALSLSAGTLSPKFNPNTTSYTVAVKNSVTSCNVYATAADSGAKVAVSGASALKIGKNVRTITVTAPSGAQKTYTVTINRSAEENSIESSEESSSSEENKNIANIEGVEYTVATDISDVKLFKGFTASTAKYNDEDVAVAVDANNSYKLYFLKAPESKELIPYTFDEENKIFKKLTFFTQGEQTYIYSDFPSDFNLSDNFYVTTTQIDNNDVKCYKSNESLLSDFYYLYCFANGSYGYYRYDAIDNVMQRYPEMESLIVKPIDKEEQEADNGFFARFATLSNNAKIIVVAIVLLVLAIIALIVLLIIKFLRNKELDEYYDDDDIIQDDDFDTISFNNFSLANDTEMEIEENPLEETELSEEIAEEDDSAEEITEE